MVLTCHAPPARRSLGWTTGTPAFLDEEVAHVVSSCGSQTTDQDRVALAEIELCGELMIAASAVGEERLSTARIDEVLEVHRAGGGAVRVPLRGPRMR
jgi:hypothetical protein